MTDLPGLLPEGMQLDVAYDSSTFINDSINEVTETLIIATVSRRARGAGVPEELPGDDDSDRGHSHLHHRRARGGVLRRIHINILTLLALVLAIGLVVDDAIVVLENVYRHMEMGKTDDAGRT